MEDAELAQKLFGGAELIVLEPDEVEALRLADLQSLYQEQAARMMGISRQTFGRILERAHRKVADALLNGKALKLESRTQNSIQSLKEKIMKVAFVSDDGKTISRHFGRAAYYVVLTVDDGKVVQKEQRPKLGHEHFAGRQEAHHEHGGGGGGHGFEPGAQERHAGMVQAILDCKTLIAGGMGAGAYASIQGAGIEPIVTDMQSIDDAAAAYLAGTLANHMEYLH
jgi:predicted DNA-binding protein (UPF0251 family)/predicted Fe-Mo cluster-binding NifX family protein